VGSYRANPFGLYDLIGNVWECCLDGYDAGFYGKSPKMDPVAPWTSVTSRVLRGGGFVNIASFGRSANRDFCTPDHQDNDLGVRPARAVRTSSPRPKTAGY
jgi:formylglycine-generating enzyme required for sulfatase activity